MGYIGRQEVVSHLIELFNTLDVGANYRLLFLKYSNIAVDFGVTELLIIKVAQRGWHLILTLMVEKNVESACVVIDLELGSHWFFHSSEKPAYQNNIVDRVAIELTYIIRSRLGIHYHSHSDRREYFLPARFLLHSSSSHANTSTYAHTSTHPATHVVHAATHAASHARSSTSKGCGTTGSHRLVLISVLWPLIHIEESLRLSVCKHNQAKLSFAL